MDMILVSVILASNKVDEFFYLAIKSILVQSFTDLELVIVLNGSALLEEAALRNKLNQFQNVKIINANISGLNFSLNLGINNASGKYIARMDADDISYIDRISIQYRFMEKNLEVAICGSYYDLIDVNGLVQNSIKLPTTDKEIRKALTFKNPLCHPTVMFRKDVVSKEGAYLNGKHAEDYDLWIRLSNNNKLKFANIPKSLLGYRILNEGEARRSRLAYASVSTTQWLKFITTGKPIWLIASIVSVIKAIFLAKN
jgi:glycosyltransferase involved in cell wall biosynthesis